MDNIAIIVPSLKGGGAERVVALLSKELSNSYNLYLIIFDEEDIKYSYGGSLINIGIKPNNNLLLKIINVLRRVIYIRRIKKELRIKATISFLNSANIVNILSKRADKVIISERSHLSKGKDSLLTKINKFTTKIFYNKADQIVGISKGVAQDLIDNFGLNGEIVNYIYNPIETKKVREQSREPLFGDYANYFTIVNVGRLSNAKGQWHLIRSLVHVKKIVKNIKLVILGQGELASYLKKLVEDLNLQENVEFIGFDNNPFKYISKSDLFVFSSIYEGFGNVIIEAMACGVPVISTDCKSGPREIIAPKTGIELETNKIEYCEFGVLVPVCDGNYYNHSDPLTEEELILGESIIEMYKNKDLRKSYSIKGEQRAESFIIDKVIKEWKQLLN
ncbi:glycosyltransferase [Cytobacillus sp. FSL K6-0129]|uniref:glycosyltransferase n=1 Tax=Cytobacillus sp. FSL K6-0129 TaxID=2921421 RepID=UPI0030F97A1C